jgi:hypothetical protein
MFLFLSKKFVLKRDWTKIIRPKGAVKLTTAEEAEKHLSSSRLVQFSLKVW